MRPLELVAMVLAVSLPLACTAPEAVKPAEKTPALAPAVAPAPESNPVVQISEPPIEHPSAETAEPSVVAAAPTPAGPVSDCDLQANISAARSRDGTTRYTLTLKNAGTTARTLVIPGDGSEDGRRTPMLAWSGTRDGKPAEQLERPGCGMMNQIEASEIFTLEPGASREMSTWIHGPVYGPGKYAVQLRYTNDPGKHTAASPEIAALLARSSACDVTSAPLAIKVP